MKIRVDRHLKKVEFWAQGKEIQKVTGEELRRPNGHERLIHVFSRPRIMVDTAAISRLPSVRRDAVARLLEFPERVVEYDGVSVAWSDARYPGVWAPSIDTILFASAIRRLFGERHSRFIDSFLEIGCGSGFLSKYIIQKKRQIGAPISYAHIMDINRDALLSAMDAIEDVRGGTLVSYSLNRPKQGIKVARPFDLVISNPPYVARPSSRDTNPFEGLFLYKEILERSRELMGRRSVLLTNFSSISKNEVYPAYQKQFRMKTLARMKVPLKIPLITARLSDESRKWVAYLEKHKKLMVDTRERSGYRYWQIIEIVECRMK